MVTLTLGDTAYEMSNDEAKHFGAFLDANANEMLDEILLAAEAKRQHEADMRAAQKLLDEAQECNGELARANVKLHNDLSIAVRAEREKALGEISSAAAYCREKVEKAEKDHIGYFFIGCFVGAVAFMLFGVLFTAF